MANSGKEHTYGETLEINDGTLTIKYSLITGRYWHGIGYGIAISQSDQSGTFFAVAEDISKNRASVLELMKSFHREHLEFCHLSDVLEDILPIG